MIASHSALSWLALELQQREQLVEPGGPSAPRPRSGSALLHQHFAEPGLDGAPVALHLLLRRRPAGPRAGRRSPSPFARRRRLGFERLREAVSGIVESRAWTPAAHARRAVRRPRLRARPELRARRSIGAGRPRPGPDLGAIGRHAYTGKAVATVCRRPAPLQRRGRAGCRNGSRLTASRRRSNPSSAPTRRDRRPALGQQVSARRDGAQNWAPSRPGLGKCDGRARKDVAEELTVPPGSTSCSRCCSSAPPRRRRVGRGSSSDCAPTGETRGCFVPDVRAGGWKVFPQSARCSGRAADRALAAGRVCPGGRVADGAPARANLIRR